MRFHHTKCGLGAVVLAAAALGLLTSSASALPTPPVRHHVRMPYQRPQVTFGRVAQRPSTAWVSPRDVAYVNDQLSHHRAAFERRVGGMIWAYYHDAGYRHSVDRTARIARFRKDDVYTDQCQGDAACIMNVLNWECSGQITYTNWVAACEWIAATAYDPGEADTYDSPVAYTDAYGSRCYTGFTATREWHIAVIGVWVGTIRHHVGSWCGNGTRITTSPSHSHYISAGFAYCIVTNYNTWEWDVYYSWQHGGLWASIGVGVNGACENAGDEHRAINRIAADGYHDHYDDFGF